MDIINASDAKREFGELLLRAQSEPVGINKNGKPVAVVISASEYQLLESYRTQILESAITQGIEDVQSGRVSRVDEALGRIKGRLTDG